jgi:hypothetical protein
MLLHVSAETRYCHEQDGLCDPQDRDRTRRFPEVVSHKFVRKPVGGVQRHRGDPGNHCGSVSTRAVAVRSVASVPNPDHFLRGMHAAPGSRHLRRSRRVRSASRHTRSDEGDQGRRVGRTAPRTSFIAPHRHRSKTPQDGVAARRSTAALPQDATPAQAIASRDQHSSTLDHISDLPCGEAVRARSAIDRSRGYVELPTLRARTPRSTPLASADPVVAGLTARRAAVRLRRAV